MSKVADYLNTLPYDEKQAVLKLMREGSLVLCDSIDEALAAIGALTEKRKFDA